MFVFLFKTFCYLFECVIGLIILYYFLRISAFFLGYDWYHPENNKDKFD